MRKQRGFIGGIQLYVALAALAVVTGLGLAVAYYKNSADRADAEATLARDQRDRLQLSLAASEEARTKEHQRAESLAKVGETLEQENADLKKQRERDRVAIRAGDLKLRVANACTRPSTGPEASTAPGVSDDSTTAELPREVAEDLLSLASDADEVVHQLGACQNTIREYLKQ